MGLFKGIVRAATSPIEVVARTTKEVFSRENDTDDTDGLDILTFGASRVARGALRGTSDTFEKIVDEFDD